MNLDISTGRSRKETSWKTVATTWAQLLKKLSTPVRTYETVKQYPGLPKDKQDELKDVGGFVGGVLAGGRRKSGAVLSRQLITLDADFATPELWSNFQMLFGCAACIYSTHKHTPEAPRIRLVIPLSRPVMPDEYQAIARKVAEAIDIDVFDDTTFEPERLMYWPSCPSDGVFVFEQQEGGPLNADEQLGLYHDWRNVTEWAFSSRVTKVHRESMAKAELPTSKDGAIGAFCRAYDIHKAIKKFIPDAYSRTAGFADRYTYMRGSTAGGMITYDDLFCFSHHGTDPAQGRLYNAFDLVRIHKYGAKDINCKAETAPASLPSHKAMLELCTKDREVVKEMSRARLDAVIRDFDLPANSIKIDDEPEDGIPISDDEFYIDESDLLALPEEEGTPDKLTGGKVKQLTIEQDINYDWLAGMDMDSRGRFLPTIKNVRLILNNDPGLSGCFKRDLFDRRDVVTRNLPWRDCDFVGGAFWINSDEACLRAYLEAEPWGIRGKDCINDALETVLVANQYHPVREYLRGVKWDGIKRAETLLIDYLGAEDSEFNRAVTRKSLVACVRRIFQPGCKFDYVLTLFGEQGQNKSTIFKQISKGWFSESLTNMSGDNRSMEQLAGVWIIELAELASIKKAETETVKAFITKTEDRFRPAYGRKSETYKRQCVFFGSTNEIDYLKDPTGNRRFWTVPVRVTEPRLDPWRDLTASVIDQIWAEAVVLNKAGEALYLEPGIENQARINQSEHSEKDDREGLIIEYINTLLPEDWDTLNSYQRRAWLEGEDLENKAGTVKRKYVSSVEIWVECFGGKPNDLNNRNGRFIHNILRGLPNINPRPELRRIQLYGPQRCYELLE